MLAVKDYIQYTIFPEHIKSLRKDEWISIWDDMYEKPNTEDDIHFNFYEFMELFDSNDPGIISGYTTEKYLLEFHEPEEVVLKQYPYMKKLLDQKPAYYERWHSERHLSEEQIKKAMIRQEQKPEAT